MLEKADCFCLFQIRSADAVLAVARHRMDQLRSVGFTAVQTLAPILDKLAGAYDVAQQGAIAHIGLVVQVGVPDPDRFGPPLACLPRPWRKRPGRSTAEDVARRSSVRCSVGRSLAGTT